MEVAFEVGGRMGAIAGAKFSFTGPVESYAVKTTGMEYDGNVMGSHVVLHGRRQGRIYLQGDFIENASMGHNSTLESAASDRVGRVKFTSLAAGDSRGIDCSTGEEPAGILSEYVSGENLVVGSASPPHGGNAGGAAVRDWDAVIHFDETRAVEPLDRTAGWEPGEAPETFPSGV